MPRICDVVELPGGVRAVVCGSGPRKRKCQFCATGVGTLQCDFPKGRRTCDAYVCRGCATHLDGKDIDFCPNHKYAAENAKIFG